MEVQKVQGDGGERVLWLAINVAGYLRLRHVAGVTEQQRSDWTCSSIVILTSCDSC